MPIRQAEILDPLLGVDVAAGVRAAADDQVGLVHALQRTIGGIEDAGVHVGRDLLSRAESATWEHRMRQGEAPMPVRLAPDHP